MAHLIDTVGSYVAFGAAVGLLLLLPLYLSQHRDLVRLRAWMQRDPDHPQADARASEAILDRAEAEVAALLADRGEPVTVAAAPTAVAPPAEAPASAEGQPASAEGQPASAEGQPASAEGQPPPEPVAAPGTTPTGLTPIPAAQRVTAERPALERITMERAALEPPSRWRRFGTRVTRPRMLAMIALVAVALGVAGVIGARALLSNNTGGGNHHHGAAATGPAHTTVSVLNGTSMPGLAARVSDQLHENGYRQGAVGATRRSYQQTVVMYSGGDKRAAEKVAHVLGVTPVQRIDRTTRKIAGAADVVVIAGADRVRH